MSENPGGLYGFAMQSGYQEHLDSETNFSSIPQILAQSLQVSISCQQHGIIISCETVTSESNMTEANAWKLNLDRPC